MKKKQGGWTSRAKDSLNKNVDEGGSDLQVRESPKPTLSTNRIQKSKSASCGLLPNLDLQSDTRLTHIMASSRQTGQGLHQSIEQLASRWHQLSSEQLTSLQHLCSYAQSMMQEQPSLKVKFLIALSNRHTITKKLQDAKINLEYLRMMDEKKIPFDHNKMLILDILCQKLQKKLFFCHVRFRHLLNKFKIEMVEMGQPKQSYTYFSTESRMAATNLLAGRLASLIDLKIGQYFQRIREFAEFNNLQSQSEADSLQYEEPRRFEVYPDDGDQPSRPQSRLPSEALELTLSPNYNISDQNFIHEQTHYHSAERDSIENVIKLIAGLKCDLRATLSRFREDRETKSKETYFSMWKIKFLIRHLQARLTEHYEQNLINNVFRAWRSVKKEQMSPKNEFSQQIFQIKSNRSRKCLKFLCEYTRHRKDMKKIEEICHMIYLKNLKTKALYALAKSNLWEGDSYHQQNQDYNPTEEYIAYEDSHEHEQIVQKQTPRYANQEEDDSSDQIGEHSINESAATVFYNSNLLTRIFKQFQYTCRFNKSYRKLKKVICRQVFRMIFQASRYEERLTEKGNRFLNQNQRSLIFRCFTALKKNIQGKLANFDTISYLAQKKKRQSSQKYFSVLKIIWKMRKIKERKAEKLHQYHVNTRYFRIWQQCAEQNMVIRQKEGRLLSSIYQRNSIVLMRNLIRGYLKSKQLQKKTQQLQYWLFDRNKEHICEMLEHWRKKTARNRNFRMVVHRFRKLREKQQKGRIFERWYELTYEDDKPVAEVGQPTNEHRYWLQRYYQRLLTK